ncbi:MAG: hypothetical protein M1822_000909 [Bathelium mastoideum]|nr:MAG: hypothetical protein M1822_000909 [Bathelium mastoideum]
MTTTTGYAPAAPPPSEEELAYLQKLSNEYEPEVTGPLVGELQPSSNITTEYARADPIFIKKTEALPHKYSSYRACRGDGNCGWRAIAFAYFEALVRLGDKTKVHAEITRLKSFQNILDAAGFQFELYEDFAEELYDLLRKTAASLPPPDDGNPATDVKAILLAAFNDEAIQASIITFLRILTSAWIKTRVEDYQPFLMNEDVFSYCGRAIEPFRHEIEHIGVNALCDVLLKPALFSLEILYLDRTPGDEGNMYTFDAEYPLAHLRLLYRPGHYDILYKVEDVQQPIPTSHPISAYNMQVGSYDAAQDHTNGARDLEYLHMIPGISLVDGISPYSYAESGLSSPISTHPPPLLQQQQHSLAVHPVPAHPVPAAATPAYAPPPPPPLQMPSQSLGLSARLPIHPPQNVAARAGPFRPSVWEYEPGVASGPPPQFTTSIFRK